jgi:membrane-associated phospholipid phosphatase
MMRILSGLADAALLVPAAMVLLCYFVALRQFATARIWLAALVVCGIASLASKLLFHACGAELTAFDVTSPSGHASLATIFYGGLAILIGSGRPVWQKAVLACATLAFLLLVGVSRVRTGAHSPEEVVLGFLIGGLCVGLFWGLHRRAGRPTLSLLPLAIGFLGALLLLGGRHFSLEPYIGRTASRLSALLDVCKDVAPTSTILQLER